MSSPLDVVKPRPNLTAEEEAPLVAAAQRGDASAADTIVRSQARYIYGQAVRWASPTVTADDLFQVGVLGLMDAVASFDPAAGVRLFTHARRAIQRRMSAEVAETGSTVTVPARTFQRYAQAVRSTETLAEAREFAGDPERSRRLEPEAFNAVHDAISGAVPILHEDDLGAGAGDVAETATAKLAVAAMLGVLDDRSRTVVRMAFGLDGDPMDDGAIASVLGIHRTRVVRIRNAALAAMREAS